MCVRFLNCLHERRQSLTSRRLEKNAVFIQLQPYLTFVYTCCPLEQIHVSKICIIFILKYEYIRRLWWKFFFSLQQRRFIRTRKSCKEETAVCEYIIWNQTSCFLVFYLSFFFFNMITAVFMQLSNHLFEELAMDVYDEVDRRETDAGKVDSNKRLRLFCSAQQMPFSVFEHYWCCFNVVCSVVGHTESQHLGNRNSCGPFSSCESRVFINKKPGNISFEHIYGSMMNLI